MAERIEPVECLGLRCPEPILRAAKAARLLGPGGGLLEIHADDDAFPVDLKSWCRSVNAEVVTLEQRGQTHRAVVRMPRKAGAPEAPSNTAAPPPAAAPAPSPPP